MTSQPILSFPEKMALRQARLNHLRRLLRTPLNAVIGYSEMLREEAQESRPEAIQSGLRRLRRTGQKLLVTVNSLLDSSGFSTGQLDLTLVSTSARLRGEMRPLVTELLTQCAQVAADCAADEQAELLPDLARIRSAGADLNALLEALQCDPGLSSTMPAAAVNGVADATKTAAETPTNKVEPGTVLIVDDDEINRDILLRQLRRDGHTVYLAASGREALQWLHGNACDLVLLDVMMPGLSGFAVLEQLQANEAQREIPVIVLSAADELDCVVRCLEMGARDYLAKPFDPVLLRVRLGACLERKRLRDQLRQQLRVMQDELDIAARIQQSILPGPFTPLPQAPEVALFAEMIPAREVGGDFYDYFPLDDDRLGLVIGDVSGKGAPAALFMAVTRTLVKSSALTGLSAGACLQQVNRLLTEENRSCLFVTLLYAILNLRTGHVEYANAGHHPPYRLHPQAGATMIPVTPGLPLGIMEAAHYETARLQLTPGEGLFLYTDGIPEAADAAGAFFTDQKLQQCLQALRTATPATLLQRVVGEVRAFAGEAPQSDDLTMLAVRYGAVAQGACL